MRKGLIRDLDVTDDEGRVLPILSRGENAMLSAAALYALIQASTHVPIDSRADRYDSLNDGVLWETVYEIACSDADGAREAARSLILRLPLNETLQATINDFAENFLLCALVPIERATTRQVLKFSYHWEGSRARVPGSSFRRAWSALGYCSSQMLVEVPGVDTAQSYHLEVPAPRGLLVTGMIPGEAGARPRLPEPEPIGHLHVAGSSLAAPLVTVHLRLARPGLLTTMLLYLVLASALLALMRFLPEALQKASENKEAVTALVTLAPALLFGLATRGAESSIVSRILLPLRCVAGFLSAYFLGLSLVLILAAPEGVFEYVKWGLDGTVLLTTFVAVGYVLTWLSERIVDPG
ncbi:hypothetical protein QWJ90_12570 [Microbacterium oryzae]|uniref:hypothetical protein n=1 Tax=Microbacterium oryzae TaxID=743009 RepID=UPI0025B1F039|nr:hypothetical protein [Microbacterium oryzae]MDN3311763.1 hypothetical protein [Microbacterium oryzae]